MATGIFITAPQLLSTRRLGASSGTTTNDVKFFGGIDITVSSTVPVAAMEEYNGTSWSAGPDLLAGVHSMGTFHSTSDTFYATGKDAVSVHTKTYEFTGAVWSDFGADVLTGVYAPAGSAGPITSGIIAGGYTVAGSNTTTTITQELSGTSWNSGGTFPTSRGGGIALGTSTSAWFAGNRGGADDPAGYRYNGSNYYSSADLHASTQNMAAFGSYTGYGGLVTGGSYSGASGEIYPSGTNLRYANQDIGPAPPLLVTRTSHAATGDVRNGAMVMGGYSTVQGYLSTCEEYVFLNTLAISEAFVARKSTASTTVLRLAQDAVVTTGMGGTTLYFSIIVKDDDVPTTTTNTNWTKRLGFESNNAIYIDVWSSEVGGANTFDCDSEESTIISFSISGCDPSTIETTTIVGSSGIGSTPSITPTNSKSLVLFGIGTDQDNIDSSVGTDNVFSTPAITFQRHYSSTGAGGCSQLMGISNTSDTQPTLAGVDITLYASDQWGGWALAIAGIDNDVTTAITGPSEVSSGLSDIYFAPGVQGVSSTSSTGTILEEHSGSLELTSINTPVLEGTIGTSIIGTDTTLEGQGTTITLGSMGVQESGSAEITLALTSSGLGTLGWTVFSLAALTGSGSTSSLGTPLGEYGAHLSPIPIVRSWVTSFYKKRRELSHSFIREVTTNTGVTRVLGLKSQAGYGRFSDVYSGGESLYYVIDSDAGREVGIGEFILDNRLKRVKVLSSLINGVYNDTYPLLVQLTGTSVISLAPNDYIINDIYQEAETRAFMLMGSF